MNFELQPTTETGKRYVALMEEHAADFATRAAAHDRDGSFPFENIEAMQKSGCMAVPVPAAFGGLGVESVLDMMIGMSRLGRGDASTAIASNMHIAVAGAMTRLHRAAIANGETDRAALLAGLLGAIGAAQVVTCFPSTEPGTDISSPFTEATPVDGGFHLNGLKIFGTLSPVAQLFLPNVRIARGDGSYRIATAIVPRGTPGMTINDDWDALGMRSSGSNSITFKDCFVAPGGLFDQPDEWGVLATGFLELALFGNLALVSVFLGVAEQARDLAVAALTSRKKGKAGKMLAERIPIQQIIGEIEIEIASMRAIIERTGHVADAYFAQYLPGQAPVAEAHAVFKEFQAMKWVVNHGAIRVVDHAMTACGGNAYTSGNALSRLYRDVRAGPFMQPFAPYEALEYVGKIALGLEPALDR